ncbi:MAG: hypothetical protein ACREOU_04640 [Candidatus Eiseniibacteriota bacterium]
MRVKPAFSPADRSRARARAWRAAGVLLVASGLFAALAWPLRTYLIDDTYIHLQYAKNFRDGHGLVFNVGERVYGTTSPLWSLGLGWLGRSGIDLFGLAKALALLFGFGSLLATALALRRFLDAWVEEHAFGAGRAELAWALGVLAFAADPWLVRWSSSGMETALGVFLVAAGFAAYFGRRPWGNHVFRPAVWWSLAALVRPEALLLLVGLVLRIALSSSPPGLKLRRLAWVALPAILVHGPWLAYAASFYGTITPATLAAKTAAGTGPVVFGLSLFRQIQELAASRGVEMVALLALLPLFSAALWRRRAEHFLPLLWLFGVPLLYALRGVHPISRYLLPLAPVLICYAWGALATVAASERRRVGLAAAKLVAIAAAALLLDGVVYGRLVLPHAQAFSEDMRHTLGGLAAWCRERTPPDAAVAIPDIGLFGYESGRPVVDLAGLVTPGIARLIREVGNSEEGTLVTGLAFESVARPAYLVDRADRPRRLLFESPYAPCLEVLYVGSVRYRGLRHPDPAYYTLYRVDWEAFDRMAGAQRHARAGN